MLKGVSYHKIRYKVIRYRKKFCCRLVNLGDNLKKSNKVRLKYKLIKSKKLSLTNVMNNYKIIKHLRRYQCNYKMHKILYKRKEK